MGTWEIWLDKAVLENRKNLCQEVPRGPPVTSLRVYVESCNSLMEKYTFTRRELYFSYGEIHLFVPL